MGGAQTWRMMRRACVLAILVLLFLPAITARADPATSVTGPGQRKAEWTFSNPTNYTLDNVTLDATGGVLALHADSATGHATGPFSPAPALLNIQPPGAPR